ncbi:MAG: DNA/RNA nuclease SfsA [Desulfobacteraceae bacterium]
MNDQTREETDGFLQWPRLIQGTLLRRYNRFMADVRLRNGHVVTAHCPNSGSMQGCSEPGRPVYLSRHANPKRRLKYTWEMIHMATSWVGVNTLIPNRLVAASIQAGQVDAISGYPVLRREVKYGGNSRIDLLLEQDGDRCFVEVKNCTLVNHKKAYFPDAVTARGLKHLVSLQREVANGHRAVMFYLVQRMDALGFSPADHIDAIYGAELRKAVQNGVEIMAYDVIINRKGIRLHRPLEVSL